MIEHYFTFCWDQGCLNKEIQLKLCEIFSILIFIRLVTLNRVKLGRTVTFMKYLASVVSLIFLPNTLVWNKITFWISNTLNLAELVVNDVTKCISKLYQHSFFHPIFHCLLKRLQKLITKELNSFSKILISIAFH